ncbi:MAG: hypothetical protein R3F30_04080 [Planctomycetota bacterium]
MKLILPLVSALAITTGLQAQLGSAMVTSGAYGVAANKVTKDVPDKTAVGPMGLNLHAFDGTSYRSWNAIASTSARHGASNWWSPMASASVHDSASAMAGSKAGTSSPHDLTWTITSKTDVTGTVRVSYFGRVSANGGTGGCKVTFGSNSFSGKADGKWASQEFKAVKVGSAGVAISISSDCTADASSSKENAWASGSLAISFVPDIQATKCTITSDTASCKEGGTLAGTSTLSGRIHAIALNLTGGPAKAWAITFVSPKADTAKIGTGSCVMFTTPWWAGFSMTDDKGNATARYGVPATKALTAYAQLASFSYASNKWSVATSNTLKIDCQ